MTDDDPAGRLIGEIIAKERREECRKKVRQMLVEAGKCIGSSGIHLLGEEIQKDAAAISVALIATEEAAEVLREPR